MEFISKVDGQKYPANQCIAWISADEKAKHAYLFLEYVYPQQSIFWQFFGYSSESVVHVVKRVDYVKFNVNYELVDFFRNPNFLRQKTKHRQRYLITRSQLAKIQEGVENAQKNPPEYITQPSNEAQNCSVFIVALLAFAGVKVDSGLLGQKIVIKPIDINANMWTWLRCLFTTGISYSKEVSKTKICAIL